jgi:glyoxylate reductase
MNIFLTRSIPNEGIELLQSDPSINLTVYEKDQKIPREELLERVRGAHIIASILTEKIDAEVMDAAGDQLKMIANYAVGFNNIDIDAAKERGIIVTNAPASEVSESVAEHTIGLMFALAHRIVETDDFTRQGKYESWGPELLLGVDLAGKTVGIIGAGHIGSAVAKRSKALGMSIIYNNREQDAAFEEAYDATFMYKDALLAAADFVTIHVPLVKETRHLISEPEINLMKPSAYLINTSRGPIVDELALVKALTEKRIAGAGLDVYECEPLIDCDPNDNYELRSLKNVVLTPHTASATIETRQAMSRVLAKNVLAFVHEETPPNQLT